MKFHIDDVFGKLACLVMSIKKYILMNKNAVNKEGDH